MAIDWTTDVDWRQSNVEIAKAKGCTPTAVAKARKRITGQASTCAGGRPASGISPEERAAERSARTVSVLFPQEEFEALDALSRETGRTKAELIREGVRKIIGEVYAE